MMAEGPRQSAIDDPTDSSHVWMALPERPQPPSLYNITPTLPSQIGTVSSSGPSAMCDTPSPNVCGIMNTQPSEGLLLRCRPHPLSAHQSLIADEACKTMLDAQSNQSLELPLVSSAHTPTGPINTKTDVFVDTQNTNDSKALAAEERALLGQRDRSSLTESREENGEQGNVRNKKKKRVRKYPRPKWAHYEHGGKRFLGNTGLTEKLQTLRLGDLETEGDALNRMQRFIMASPPDLSVEGNILGNFWNYATSSNSSRKSRSEDSGHTAPYPVSKRQSTPQHSIIRISYEAIDYQRRYLDLVSYTKAFLRHNASVGLDQDQVFTFFEQNVKDVFTKGDPKRIWLLQQKNCPAIKHFWHARNSRQETSDGRHVEVGTSSSASSYEENRHKRPLTLTDGSDRFHVPGISLLSLHNINYVNVTKAMRLHHRYYRSRLSESKMRAIWRGIVLSVYHWETYFLKVAKLTEVDSDEAKAYWRAVSDENLAARKDKRADRPVAADFYHVDDEFSSDSHEPPRSPNGNREENVSPLPTDRSFALQTSDDGTPLNGTKRRASILYTSPEREEHNRSSIEYKRPRNGPKGDIACERE